MTEREIKTLALLFDEKNDEEITKLFPNFDPKQMREFISLQLDTYWPRLAIDRYETLMIKWCSE